MGFEEDGVDGRPGDGRDRDGGGPGDEPGGGACGPAPDEAGEDGPGPPLLPPDDRIWRHPSEMAARPSPRRNPAFGHDRPGMTTVVALTSCISALISLGVVVLVGTVRDRLAAEPAAAGVADVAALTERVRPAVTQVVTRGPAGERWGSGVIYRRDGLMLTSHRIVAGVESARVLLDDGREVVGRVVGSDPDTDVALLRLEGSGYRPAVMGSLREVKVGHPAITIGSPTGSASGPTVSPGVVGALGQRVDDGGRTLFDMIQTDGPVAPGCSGAAVVDHTGAVIAIASVNVPTEAGLLGYAIPIDIVRAVADQLLNHGPVSHGWLGVEGDRPSDEQVRDMGIPGGALVKRVVAASPAEAAGVEAADVITAVNGHPVSSMAELVGRLRLARPGQAVNLTVVRGDATRALRATLAERPA